MVILVDVDFLVTYPKSAKNCPSKLVFGLLRVLRRFWLPAEMEKAGDTGYAVRANFFQLCYFFGFLHNFAHNFTHFCTLLL